MLEGKWLEGLYPDQSQLAPGQEVSLPWQIEGGWVEYWKAVVVSEATEGGDMKKQKLSVPPCCSKTVCVVDTVS